VTGSFAMFITNTFSLEWLKGYLLLQEDCIHALMCLLECEVALKWVELNVWYSKYVKYDFVKIKFKLRAVSRDRL
jgi:hypothetical protein